MRAWGPGTVPLACLPCGALHAAGLAGGRPGGWGALTFVRGVWCHELTPTLQAVEGAGSQALVDLVYRARVVWAWGPSDSPTACARASRRCALWGRREGVPPGGASGRCEGRLGLAARPPPAARPWAGQSGSPAHMPRAQVCRPGGPAMSPLWCVPCAALRAAGVAGLLPRHYRLGCAVWVCVLRLGFRLRPTTPGWGVEVCVCLLALSACTPPLLAGVCRVGACVWARVPAAPRHFLLGCWGVCVLVCAPRLYPAIPGWGVRCWCVCLGSGFGCAPPLLAGVLGGVCLCAHSTCTTQLLARFCGMGACAWAPILAAPRHSWLEFWGVVVFVCALCLYPATPRWGMRLGCLCLCSGFGCAPPLLVGVLGCVCACVRGPLVPRHSWPGCAVRACVFGLGLWLCPAFPGWGVRVCVFVCALLLYPSTPGWGVRCGCVCLGSGFGCAPPLLAGVLGCVCARLSCSCL